MGIFETHHDNPEINGRAVHRDGDVVACQLSWEARWRSLKRDVWRVTEALGFTVPITHRDVPPHAFCRCPRSWRWRRRCRWPARLELTLSGACCWLAGMIGCSFHPGGGGGPDVICGLDVDGARRCRRPGARFVKAGGRASETILGLAGHSRQRAPAPRLCRARAMSKPFARRLRGNLPVTRCELA